MSVSAEPGVNEIGTGTSSKWRTLDRARAASIGTNFGHLVLRSMQQWKPPFLWLSLQIFLKLYEKHKYFHIKGSLKNSRRNKTNLTFVLFLMNEVANFSNKHSERSVWKTYVTKIFIFSKLKQDVLFSISYITVNASNMKGSTGILIRHL